MYFVGIDQALNHTGVVVLGETGAQPVLFHLVDASKYRGAERLEYLFDNVMSVLTEFKPTHAALEGYSLGSTHRAMDLGEAGGMIRLAFAKAKVPFAVVAPKSLKKYVTSSGDSDKEKMRVSTREKWGVDIDQNDLCDAYGLAQVARALVKNDSVVRCELEVLKLLQSKAVALSPKMSRKKTLSI